MKIYTRTGDQGTTSLFSGERVSKSHPRVVAYGTVDELNALLGLARSHSPEAEVDAHLLEIQYMLFTLGSDLATVENSRPVPRITDDHVRKLEEMIDAMTCRIPELRYFILPGGTPCAAALHVARCTCRRAEREALAVPVGEISAAALIFLNRLSDCLFVVSRFQNFLAGVEEPQWIPSKS